MLRGRVSLGMRLRIRLKPSSRRICRFVEIRDQHADQTTTEKECSVRCQRTDACQLRIDKS